jgi:hypothetical protein
MTTVTRTYKSHNTGFFTKTFTDLDVGSTDFGFVDQKGRACGYSWVITQVVVSEPISVLLNKAPAHLAAGEPFIELISNPTRNGKGYGPAFNRALVRTLEEARQLATKRADASRKRDAKKFVK